MSIQYNLSAERADLRYGSDYQKCLELHTTANDYILKSSYQKNLSEIYLSKKLDLEEELQYLTYRKA